MIDLDNIKEIEYEGYEWDYNSNIICPYCGYENEPDSEYDDRDFEEAHETECGSCEKHFMVIPTVEIQYSSEPIENYYISKVKSIKRNIETYEKYLSENTEENRNESYEMIIEHFKKELDTFQNTFKKYFEDNQD